MSTTDECASALIETIPEIMQEIRRHVRSSRGSDLSLLQLRALAFLAREPGSPLAAVADYVGLTSPSMSTQVSNLVNRGLIHRAPSPTDRRYVTLMLTDEGQRVLTQVREKTRDSLSADLAHLSAAERRHILDAVTLLRSVFAA